MEDAFRINNKSQKKRNDTSVQGTNDSSVLSKISTCKAGYFDDKYLQFFANKIAKRSSLVNRGYYIRAKLIDFVLDEFLKKNTKNQNQILNLGAGFDATYFRLKNQNRLFNTLFIEIDFPDVIKRKVNLIKNNENLYSLCPDLKVIQEQHENIAYMCKSSRYVLIGCDMRNTVLVEAFLKIIEGFSDSDMTFLLSEVVLTYMAVNSCNSVIRWIADMFHNCVLTVYEQINPFDPFGQVMCQHFKKLGSPLKCIAKYPYENDQIDRYRAAGFNDSFALKANDFYTYHISAEEKHRLDQLEMFDEYEPWHLKCSHYTVITATKGQSLTELAKNLYSKINDIPMRLQAQLNANSLESTDSAIIKLKPFNVRLGIRYGHRICVSGSKLFVFGGFGENVSDLSGKHMRHNTIDILDLNTMEFSSIKSVENVDRIFHTCELLPTADSKQVSILLTYGRSNPSKMFDSIAKINIPLTGENKIDELNITQEKLYPKSEVCESVKRFRHASCMTSDSRIFIHGGKYFEDSAGTAKCLSDAYFIDSQYNLEKINIDNLCTGRHSHCISLWKDYLIISGGLDENENPLSDIILFNSKNFETIKITPRKGQILERYSHTSVVVDDTLILIGGCNFSNRPPGVCFLDLNNLAAFEFNIPFQTENSEPLMLIQHQSHVIDKNRILILGGGAICFTFGTHLNRQPFLLDLTDCWSKFYAWCLD